MFKPTNRNNPCPVCGNTSEKCREGKDDPDFILCSGFPDTRAGEIVGSWKSLGQTKDGFWCKFKPDNSGEWNDERQRLHDEAKRRLAVDRARQDAESQRKSLSSFERHNGYTQLLAELTLHPDDRADLVRRGFTDEQIITSGFKSISPYQWLKGKYHRLLPGISQNKITLPHAGYLCPVRDADGLIVACQVRVRDAPDGGRYRWLSGGEGTLHLYADEQKELPLAVFIPEGKPEGLSFAEGVGAKPFLTSQRRKEIIVGAAGGQWANSTLNVETILAKWEGEKKATFYLDAGDVFNHQVMGRWNRLEELLIELGWTVKWAWWGQFRKTDGDIDEIDLAKTKIIYYGTEDFRFVVEKQVKDWGKSEAIRKAQEPLRSLTYKPDLILETRYIPLSILSMFPQSGIIAIKSNKGSGKSRLQAEVIRLASFEGGGYILSITPRIALGREQALKWKITWIGDKGKTRIIAQSSEAEDKKLDELVGQRAVLEGKLETLENMPIQLSLMASEQRHSEITDLRVGIEALSERIEAIKASSFHKLGLCWDSLWKMKGRDMSNSLILLDEAEMGLAHMVMSDTCRNSRAEILKVFENLICQCILNGGRVILADADLTDIPIDYINSLLPQPVKPYVVFGKFMDNSTRWQVSLRTGSKDCTIDEIIARLKAGEYLAVTTDSRAEGKALEKLILKEIPEFCSFIEDEQITDKARGGVPCVIRIDRETTRCEAGKYFVEHPNEEIEKWRPRCLIYSPSMGVGVSIDEHVRKFNELNFTVPYFDAVFGLFLGVIEPAQCRQQLGRPRANVPRVVWVKTTGLMGKGCKSFFPDEINRQCSKYRMEGALDIMELAEANLKEHCLKGKPDYDDFELYEEGERLRKQFTDKDSRIWNNPHIILYSRFKARNNYGLANLAALLEKELKDEGHEVNFMPGVKTATGKVMKRFKEEFREEEANGISAAPEISDERDREIKRNPTKTEEENWSSIKHGLQKILPGLDLTPDYVLKAVVEKRGSWLWAHRRFFYLNNSEALKNKDCLSLIKSLKSWAMGESFAPDLKLETTRIKAIIATGLFDWIDLNNSEKEYTGNSSEAKEFLERCLKIKKQLYTALEMPVFEKLSPIGVAKNLLLWIGLDLKENKASRKTACRKYRIDVDLLNDPDRIATLEALQRAWEEGQVTEVKEPPKTEAEVEKETSVAIAENVGKPFKMMQLSGMFGNSENSPSTKWEYNYKLLEPASQFQDAPIFESPGGKRVAIPEGRFKLMTNKDADSYCLDIANRLEASIPNISHSNEILKLWGSCEALEETLDIKPESWNRLSTAVGKACEWIERTPDAEAILAF